MNSNQNFLTLPLTLSPPSMSAKSVVELIKSHFRQKNSVTDPPVIPKFSVASHQEPRFSCFIESEAGGVSMLLALRIVSEYNCSC